MPIVKYLDVTLESGSAPTAAYAYLANSDLPQTTTSKYGRTIVLTATRTWDFGARLRGLNNGVGGAGTPVSAHLYAYYALNRRTRATLADGSAWLYDYDNRNEVVSGKRVWADRTPVTGQQHEYAFDNLGNRTSTQAGGDANGARHRPLRRRLG